MAFGGFTVVEPLIDLVGFELVGYSKVWLSRVCEAGAPVGGLGPRGVS